MTARIYLASSWRNIYQPGAIFDLRTAGFQVYDFRNPGPGNKGFAWKETGLLTIGGKETALSNGAGEHVDPVALRQALAHPVAEAGYQSDFQAMDAADICVLLLPAGRSAHLEAGYMAGQGKPTLVYVPLGRSIEPELMYKLFEALPLPDYADLQKYKDVDKLRRPGNIYTNLNELVALIKLLELP